MTVDSTLAIFLACLVSAGGERPSTTGPRFEKLLLTEEFHSEGAAVADIDSDGHNDIISGPFWYAGPDFRSRSRYLPGERFPITEYSAHFFTWTHDLDLDGDPDILVVAKPGQPAIWYENPGGANRNWRGHKVFDSVGNESPHFLDLTGDGKPELICIWDGAIGYVEPNWSEPARRWTFHPATPNRDFKTFSHGLGVGDLDGDGRLDLLEANGWWRQPEQAGELFQFHEVRFAESGGSQMFVYDFDGDGDGDVVSAQNAHGWGLRWFEQVANADGVRFRAHTIMDRDAADSPVGLTISQLHAVALADLDGDGLKDIITGKRFWAHAGSDPGATQLPVLAWFRTIRDGTEVRFEPHWIDLRCGVGTQLTVADVSGNGRADVVIGNKLGTFVLINKAGDAEARRTPEQIERLQQAGTDLFRTHIRATPPLDPDVQLSTFVLPEGFEAELVASEPDIAKPMNLAFDAKGRLWVSSSEEYPYPAPETRQGKDTIKILEDSDGDGRFETITTFADGLSIPIGLYPYQDGVVCFSIPNIWFLRDTDGDGKADVREKLYGPFDTSRDTHGMINGFTRGLDGWLYACHGFNNQTTVSGSDGHEIQMHSGNIFRMKLDGFRVELFTHGQVNPFGMTITPLGDILTADCHTKPLSLLLQGGYHDSFGKPHDGLGYIPNVMEHLHSSTGIAGIALGRGTTFPAIYRDACFCGNVLTGRINRNTLRAVGSSVRAQEEPDLLISADPWFRPVDLQIGPDGALYVADFYNRIIGHYEVELDHPGRDRHRGRIWRIAYTGTGNRRDDTPVALPKSQPVSAMSLDELFAELASNNATRTSLAADRIVTEFAATAELARRHLGQSENDNLKTQSLWILHRLGAVADSDLKHAAADPSTQVRVHAFKVLGEQDSARVFPELEQWLQEGFSDSDPMVRRSAVMAASRQLSPGSVKPLIQLFHQTRSGDVHLKHAILIALKHHLAKPEWFADASTATTAADIRLIGRVCLALKGEHAGDFVLEHLDQVAGKPDQITEYIAFAARYVSPRSVPRLIRAAKQRFGDEIDEQLKLLGALRTGLEQRGTELPPTIRNWALALATELLGDLDKQIPALSWTNSIHPAAPGLENPWALSTRRESSDGMKSTPLWSSHPKGEHLTGIYRSEPFELGERLGFFIAGHDGHPSSPPRGNNLVRLRAAESNEILASYPPPRDDVAQYHEWNTKQWAGQRAVVEIVDGDARGSFAWLAVGRFSIASLNPDPQVESRRRSAELIGAYQLSELRQPLEKLLRDSLKDSDSSLAFAKALVQFHPNGRLSALAHIAKVAGASSELQRTAAETIIQNQVAGSTDILRDAMKVATFPEQRLLAIELTADSDAAATLLSLVQSGHASARLLSRPLLWRRFQVVGSDEQVAAATEIREQLPDENLQVARLIRQRKQSFLTRSGSPEKGEAIYGKSCAACHKIGNNGKQVGPNLDGIGNRGIDRITEDLFAPNRNVDVAFRASTILTKQGQVLSGLVKARQGAQIILVDTLGKELTIATDSIEEEAKVKLSPMPANFGELLKDQDYRDLMAYLLSKR